MSTGAGGAGGAGTPPRPGDVEAPPKSHLSQTEADVAKTASQNQTRVEVVRARMGLAAVAVSDVAIAIAAIIGVIVIHSDKSSSTAVVSILSTAFTAVGTLTTAYLGIKASANTAQNSMSNQAGNGPASG